MKRKHWVTLAVAVAAATATVAGLTTAGSAAPARQQLTKVTLQLKWVAQAQFAGYYAAKTNGYYRQMGLDVNIRPGGPDIIPEQVVAGGQAQFGLDWLPSLMSSRDKGVDLVNIAQVFQRSGLTLISWKDSGLNSVGKLKGKTVANWLGGNEYEVYAALVKNGMDPVHNKGVKIFQQPFDMNFFMKRQVDAASAMTYNELAQVLETKNPKTKKLTKLSDLNVIPMQKVGTGMLEDGVFTTGKWIKDKSHQELAKKFLAASFEGWAYCRTHLQDCTNIVLSYGPALPKGHQRWMMNEINALVWPSPKGIGIMDKASYTRTAQIAKKFAKLKKTPGPEAYRTDIAKAALGIVKTAHVDVNGLHYKKAKVSVTAGGK